MTPHSDVEMRPELFPHRTPAFSPETPPASPACCSLLSASRNAQVLDPVLQHELAFISSRRSAGVDAANARIERTYENYTHERYFSVRARFGQLKIAVTDYSAALTVRVGRLCRPQKKAILFPTRPPWSDIPRRDDLTLPQPRCMMGKGAAPCV